MVRVLRRPVHLATVVTGLVLLGATAQAQIQRSRHQPVPLPPPRQAPALLPTSPLPPVPVQEPDSRAAQAPPVLVPPARAPLNMVRTAPEQIGQVPGHFFWIRQGLQAVQDPVDGQLVFLNDEGRVVGRARLPAGFAISEIFPEAGLVRLIDAGRRQIVIPRNIDPDAASALQETSVRGNGGARLLRLVRRSPQHLLYHDERRGGGRALDIRSISGGTLALAYEIGPGSGDNRYLVSEEIVGAKPSLQVRVFVQRFDRAGNLTGVASVPLDGMDSVPRDFIAVTGEGAVRVLVPAENGVQIRQIEFSPYTPRGRKLNENELRNFGKVGRDIAVDTNLADTDAFNRFRSTDDQHFNVVVPTPPISRDSVLKNANAYLTVNWVMAKENYSRPGIENRCSPSEAKFWLRPMRFTSDLIGQTIGAMPYRWGGDDTPETFRTRLEWGALAGDICTCRSAALDYCLMPESAGVDCSGFVSRAWGIEKRGTSGLLDVSTDIGNIADMKPGDAFDWPGRHIRLFVAAEPGAAMTYTVLESSTRLDCEGVCVRTYRPSELYGYRLIRYRGITEQAEQ